MRLIQIVVFTLFFLMVGFATAQSAPCIMLGTQPSLIIKFKNNNSDLLNNKSLDISSLNYLSSLAKLKFTRSAPMAGNAHLIFFEPLALYIGCYEPEWLNNVINRLKQDSNVEYVTPNRRVYLTGLSPQQWDMNTTALGGIDAIDAWNTTKANANVIVADLDTGIFPNNSLTPNLRSGASFTNNGTVIAGATPSCAFGVCEGAEHGTHTAGTMAASGVLAYGLTIFGVAPAANILPINVFTKFTGQGECGAGIFNCLGGNEADYLNAIYWLTGTAFSGLGAAPSVVAINMSFGAKGAPCDRAEKDAFDTLLAHNITPVAAAGNDDVNMSNFSPANCSEVIAVAATGPTRLKADYSNYGSKVALAAPGGDSELRGLETDAIYSTSNQGYEWMEGTSMAAPHVTGLVALLYARDPTMSPARALQIMQANVTPFAVGSAPRSCGTSTSCGAGIINANAAVMATAVPTVNWTSTLTIEQLSTMSVNVSWNAASWSNQSTTPIIYSVTLDGVAVPSCQNITVTTCTLNNLTTMSNGVHTVTVTALDYRGILQAATAESSFVTSLVAPTLTLALRNPTLSSEVWINYSNLGSDNSSNVYSLVGVPTGVSITLDKTNQRFILENVPAQQLSGVSIVVSSGGLTPGTSNMMIIASTDFKPPILNYAVRNPAILTQARVYYTSLGSYYSDNTYILAGLANQNLLSAGQALNYLIFNNINVPTAAEISILVSNPRLGAVQSLPVRLSSITG